MKSPRSFIMAILIIVFSTFGIIGCSTVKDSSNSPTGTINETPKSQELPEIPIESSNSTMNAINEIRKSLELPELPIEFIENTSMVVSPSGKLEVANYKDSEGRIYSVVPTTNQIVEIDARTVLSNISPNAPSLSPDEIKTKAIEYISAVVPDFETQQSLWQYDEISFKGEKYFFTWYGEYNPSFINRPFLRIFMHKSGAIFAYYNTLTVEK